MTAQEPITAEQDDLKDAIAAELEDELEALRDVAAFDEASYATRFYIAEEYRQRTQQRERARVALVAAQIANDVANVQALKQHLETVIAWQLRWKRRYPWVVEEATSLQKRLEAVESKKAED